MRVANWAMQKAIRTAATVPSSIENGAATPAYTMIRPSPKATLAPGAIVVADWNRTRPSPMDRSRLGDDGASGRSSIGSSLHGTELNPLNPVSGDWILDPS